MPNLVQHLGIVWLMATDLRAPAPPTLSQALLRT